MRQVNVRIDDEVFHRALVKAATERTTIGKLVAKFLGEYGVEKEVPVPKVKRHPIVSEGPPALLEELAKQREKGAKVQAGNPCVKCGCVPGKKAFGCVCFCHGE